MNDSNPVTSPKKESLTTKTVYGGAWMYGRMLLTNIINLVAIAILARQLSPREFGLIALASVILQFLVVLGAQGVNEFVIYDSGEGREERVHAAFWMDLSFSTASMLIGFMLLPVVIQFYNEPGLGAVLVALLLRYPIDALSKVPDALIKKKLDFKKLEMRDTILEIFSSLAKVGLAFAGWGVWSLVIPSLIVSPLRVIIVLRMARWFPNLPFRFRLWPKIFKYSANVIGSTLMNMIITEGDTLLIGKFLGSELLGIYNLAWQSANIVTRTITGVVNKLTMPVLSAVAVNPTRLKNGVYRIFRVLSILTMPLLIGLFVVADDFILTVYGEQWEQAILPLRILIVFAVRYAVGSPAGVVYKVMGRPDINFKLTAVIVPFYLLSIWVGSQYGIVGVAVGVTLVRSIFGLVSFWLVGWLMKIRFADVLKPMFPAFVASCIMGGVVFLVKSLWENWLPGNSIQALVIFVAVGGTIYLLLLRTVYSELAHELSLLSTPLLGRYQKLVNKVLSVS